MATYGAKALTRIAVASQSAFGTAATFGTAAGEVLFNETVGSLDLGVTIDLGDTISVGKRTAIQSSQPTITGKAPILTIAESPASLRTLPILFQSIGGTASGTASPYTWTWTPTQGDVDTLDFLSFLVTDGVQQYTIRDAVPTEITLSADANGLLQAGATLAATVVSSSSSTYPTTINTNPLMPGRLMKLSTAPSFPSKAGTSPTATDFASIYNFNLSIQTGAGMVTALDGSLTAATAALTGVLDATLTFTAASNSAATTSFPITSIGSQKFLRLYGTTSDNYGIWILGSWVVENVVPLSADQDGVVVNEVTCRLAMDSTVAAGAGKSIQVIIDSPLSVMP
ncbi:MAG: hypothetical protein EBR82_46370 [Caulobacteraceae bacterium]|nr:hypothetical protein [Caulobacteraceae bacterium]